MFKSSHVVPNLKEIMEEYVEGEEEVVQETQSRVLHKEERF